MIDIWVVILDLSQYLDATDALTSAERAEFGRLPETTATRVRRAARAQTRMVLSRVCGASPPEVTIVNGHRGKPEIVGHPIHFNLSHTGTTGVLAIADTPVGVDIEPIGRPTLRALDHICAVAEKNDLAQLDPAVASTELARCWTRKEAWAKATGLGLTEATRRWRTWRPNVRADTLAMDGVSWTIADVSAVPGHVTSLCYRGVSRRSVEVTDFGDALGRLGAVAGAEGDRPPKVVDAGSKPAGRGLPGRELPGGHRCPSIPFAAGSSV